MKPNDFWPWPREPECERCHEEIARDVPTVAVFAETRQGNEAIGVAHEECPT